MLVYATGCIAADAMPPAAPFLSESQKISVAIKAAPLAAALQQLSKLSGIQFAYETHLAAGLKSRGSQAELSLNEAVAQLLRGTGLRFKRIDSTTVAIYPKKKSRSSSLLFLKPKFDTDSETQVMESIVVTGSRTRNQSAINFKHHSKQIVDALSAHEIGLLPDINMADAFRRLPGANALNDSDEGQFVTVRGVEPALNFVTIDGMAIATDQGDSRSVNMETIPASAVGGLQVFKSLTPDLDGNAIGGHLNMSTLSAYDSEGAFTQINVMFSEYSLDEVPDNDDGLGGNLDFIYSNTFGADSQYGLVVLGVYGEKRRDEQKWDPRYTYVEHADGTELPFRSRFNTAQYTNTWVRRGGSAKFEYHPDDQSFTYLNTYYYSIDEDEDRDTWSIGNGAGSEISFNSAGGGAATPWA